MEKEYKKYYRIGCIPSLGDYEAYSLDGVLRWYSHRGCMEGWNEDQYGFIIMRERPNNININNSEFNILYSVYHADDRNENITNESLGSFSIDSEKFGIETIFYWGREHPATHTLPNIKERRNEVLNKAKKHILEKLGFRENNWKEEFTFIDYRDEPLRKPYIIKHKQ